jgi:LmbE family N-acetylglucosaminyl deacetylase
VNYLRYQSRRLCRFVMDRLTSEIDERDLRRTTAVFSPHPDDETLGCGGTILKKKRAGAEVNIFFMTDGQKSHSHLIPANRLKRIRANAAIAASRMLGLEKDDIAFLEYKDGELSKNTHSAINRVKEILLRQQPDEIFIPHKREPIIKDHSATNKIVLSALRMCRRKTTIYEYPIWLWHHQPWVNVPMDTPKEILSALKQSLISELSLLKDFRRSVYIGDVLQLKRAILDQYKSQMTRLISDPRWQTLGDLSNGEFLECFFHEHEIFSQYVFNG